MQANVNLLLLQEDAVDIRRDVACRINTAFVLFITSELSWITVRRRKFP